MCLHTCMPARPHTERCTLFFVAAATMTSATATLGIATLRARPSHVHVGFVLVLMSAASNLEARAQHDYDPSQYANIYIYN